MEAQLKSRRDAERVASRRVVVGPVNRALLESGLLRGSATECFALLDRVAFWSEALAEPVLDEQEAHWLASRSVSLAVWSETSLDLALRLWRRTPSFAVDLELHAAIAPIALAALHRVSCPVRLIGFDFDQTYHQQSDMVAEWIARGGVTEVVFSLCTEMAADPIDWLLEHQRPDPDPSSDTVAIDDIRREIALCPVPVLASIRSSVARASAFQAQHLPNAAGLFFGLERAPDWGGRFPARVSLDELR